MAPSACAGGRAELAASTNWLPHTAITATDVRSNIELDLITTPIEYIRTDKTPGQTRLPQIERHKPLLTVVQHQQGNRIPGTTHSLAELGRV